MLTTAAWAPAFVRSAEAPVLEIPTRLLTWAAAAVAFPGGAASAEAATGVKPMRRHAGAAAERIVRRMILLSSRDDRRGLGGAPRIGASSARSPRVPRGPIAQTGSDPQKLGQTAR